jgi:hypothetical protein
MPSRLPDHFAILRAAPRLQDVRYVLQALGLLGGAVRIRGGFKIPCLWHLDKNPSCHVTNRGEGGALRAHCFTCKVTQDVCGLVAKVNEVNLSNARRVVELTAQLGGVSLDFGPGGRVDPQATPRPRPLAAPPAPTLPPPAEVAALWASCRPVTEDEDVVLHLESRAIEPGMVDLRDLARVLPRGAERPRWARHWSPAHRLILPAYRHDGALASVRARTIAPPGSGAKVLLPAGYTDAGTVLACPLAREILETGRWPVGLDALPVVVTEGEPDFLTAAASVSDANEDPPVILGVFSSAWSQAHANRIPDGAHVIVRTHEDLAGDRYAAAIYATLEDRYSRDALALSLSPRAIAYLETDHA